LTGYICYRDEKEDRGKKLVVIAAGGKVKRVVGPDYNTFFLSFYPALWNCSKVRRRAENATHPLHTISK
jgi:hypothetical protein